MSSDDQKKYYDGNAEQFEHGIFFGRANRNHQKKIIKICELLDLHENYQPDLYVLEIGAGTGLHAKYLTDHFSHIRYVGLDLSEKMLHHAREKMMSNNRGTGIFVVGDGNQLPFRSNSFDAVYISGSLHHFSDPLNGLKELFRTVKPGGRIVLMEPNWLFPVNFFQACFNRVERNILKMNRGNFSAWANILGLYDIEIRNFIFTPPLSSIDPASLDRIDVLAEKIPILSSFSIMLYLCGKKPKGD